MSRSGYSDECENIGLYRQAVAKASNGKRGQKFFKELIEALDAMPTKELVAMDDDYSDAVALKNSVCALGALGLKKGFAIESLSDKSAVHEFLESLNVAKSLRNETVYMNDEVFSQWFSWQVNLVGLVITDYGEFENSDAGRWQFMRAWAVSNLKKEKNESS
jgi:hypothetical protein